MLLFGGCLLPEIMLYFALSGITYFLVLFGQNLPAYSIIKQQAEEAVGYFFPSAVKRRKHWEQKIM